jgi:hypothetical protein
MGGEMLSEFGRDAKKKEGERRKEKGEYRGFTFN